MIHISDAALRAKRANATMKIENDRAVFIRDSVILGSTIITDDCVSSHAVNAILKG